MAAPTLTPFSPTVAIALLTVILTLTTSATLGNQAEKAEAGGQQSGRQALEDELDSIVRQHGNLEANDKRLAEAIISRLLVDNISNNQENQEQASAIQAGDLNPDTTIVAPEGNGVGESAASVSYPGVESLRSRQLLSALQNYDGNDAFTVFPLLPGGQALTMKRATKFGAKNHHRVANYGRNTYDFGLGKRPDGSTSNIMRFGESLPSSSSLVQPVGQFGKRPSAHRYDFGLGKRVVSVSIDSTYS